MELWSIQPVSSETRIKSLAQNKKGLRRHQLRHSRKEKWKKPRTSKLTRRISRWTRARKSSKGLRRLFLRPRSRRGRPLQKSRQEALTKKLGLKTIVWLRMSNKFKLERIFNRHIGQISRLKMTFRRLGISMTRLLPHLSNSNRPMMTTHYRKLPYSLNYHTKMKRIN